MLLEGHLDFHPHLPPFLEDKEIVIFNGILQQKDMEGRTIERTNICATVQTKIVALEVGPQYTERNFLNLLFI